MNPIGKKFVSLFIILSLLTVNCTIFDLMPTPKKKLRQGAKQKQNIILPSAWHTIKPDTPIIVTLRSGDQVRGKYVELARVPMEEYAASYAECREQLKEEIVLPELGETVTVIVTNGKKYELEFLGFDYGSILTQFELMGKIRTAREDLRLIKNIVDSRGNIIGEEAVRKLISEGKISLLSSGIIIKGKSIRTQIAWEDIDQIQKRKKGTSSYIVPLIVCGVIFGAVVVILVVEFIEESADRAMEKCMWGAVTRNSSMYAYLDTLRDFRDKYLLPNEFGSELVHLYYKYSPYVANIIGKNKVLKVAVRTKLIPLIAFCYSMVHFGPIMTGVMLTFVFMLPFFLVTFHRRKLRQVR